MPDRPLHVPSPADLDATAAGLRWYARELATGQAISTYRIVASSLEFLASDMRTRRAASLGALIAGDADLTDGAPMPDPTPTDRRSPLEHERDAGPDTSPEAAERLALLADAYNFLSLGDAPVNMGAFIRALCAERDVAQAEIARKEATILKYRKGEQRRKAARSQLLSVIDDRAHWRAVAKGNDRALKAAEAEVTRLRAELARVRDWAEAAKHALECASSCIKAGSRSGTVLNKIRAALASLQEGGGG
jgi:hypothetical protein